MEDGYGNPFAAATRCSGKCEIVSGFDGLAAIRRPCRPASHVAGTNNPSAPVGSASSVATILHLLR
jgi:hypothetical protein